MINFQYRFILMMTMHLNMKVNMVRQSVGIFLMQNLAQKSSMVQKHKQKKNQNNSLIIKTSTIYLLMFQFNLATSIMFLLVQYMRQVQASSSQRHSNLLIPHIVFMITIEKIKMATHVNYIQNKVKRLSIFLIDSRILLHILKRLMVTLIRCMCRIRSSQQRNWIFLNI